MKLNRLILMVLLVSLILMPTASAGAGDWIVKMKTVFSNSESNYEEIALRMDALNESYTRMKFINNVMRQQEIDVIAIETDNSGNYYFVRGNSIATITDVDPGNADWTFMPKNIAKMKDIMDLLETEQITASNLIDTWRLYSMDNDGVPDMQTIIVNFVYN